jgi:hypothetical protein
MLILINLTNLRMCKLNRAVLKTPPIYLTSQIYMQMLYTLYYLFNNNQEMDAYIAIEAICARADEDLIPDVLLVSIRLHLWFFVS